MARLQSIVVHHLHRDSAGIVEQMEGLRSGALLLEGMCPLSLEVDRVGYH
jgi:hypothetical protein